MTVWRMRIAYWMPKATNTHSEYAILVTFPLQQWVHKRALMLCYTFIDSLVMSETAYFLCGSSSVFKYGLS